MRRLITLSHALLRRRPSRQGFEGSRSALVGFAVDIYSFRHTFATDLYRHTKDMALVAKVLGHANMRTVERYVHLSQEEVSEGVKQFHQALLRRETLDHEEVQ